MTYWNISLMSSGYLTCVDAAQLFKLVVMNYLVNISMMTSSNGKQFPCYWSFVPGIHRSPVNSPHKGQWRGALIFSLIGAWANGWANNQEPGDFRRHRAPYDVIVMINVSQYWDGTGNSSSASRKTMIHLSYTINIMAADDFQHKEPRHQQPWYGHSSPGIFDLPEYSGFITRWINYGIIQQTWMWRKRSNTYLRKIINALDREINELFYFVDDHGLARLMSLFEGVYIGYKDRIQWPLLHGWHSLNHTAKPLI